MKCLSFSLALISLCFSNSALARWANSNDADHRYEFWKSSIQMEKDGTYTREVEFKATILKNSAINSLGNFVLTYNKQSEEVTILSAQTINGEKLFPVDQKFIEDKPLASSPSGFDQAHQILITFPHVGIKSEIQLRYRIHRKSPPYKGFFSYSRTFRNNWLLKAEINIQSALPLFYKLNDPHDFFTISYQTHKDKSKKHELSLNLKRPIYKRIVDERRAFLDLNLFPRIEAASEKDWSRMVEGLAPRYEDRIAEPLPEMYQDILKSAQKLKTGSEEQINFVMSSLLDKIRYMGDWRPINGGYVPRPLAAIAETGFGDCKDLSVSLSAILNQLGFESKIALVLRSFAYHSSFEFALPNAMAFNHAIVRAEINGQTFWLDPTNFLVYSRSAFADVSGRPALVLKQPISQMTRTPELSSSGSEYQLLQNFEIVDKQLIKVTGSIHFKGLSASSFTGASLRQSKESIDHQLIQVTGADISTLKQWEVEDYDLSSRVVKDFSVQLSYIMKKNNSLTGYTTQLGPVFFFPYPLNLQYLFISPEDRASDLFLGQPRTIVFISKLNNIEPVGDLKFDCDIQSPWLSASRELASTQPLTIKDRYEFKRKEISAQELQSEDFLKLQDSLKRCFAHFAMIYTKAESEERAQSF